MMSSKDLEQKFTRAMLAFESGNWSLAEQSFKRITTLWPDCKEAWFQLGMVYQRQGLWQSAVDMFEQVLELDPNIQEVYFNLGMMAFNQGDFGLATAYWQKSLSINPDYFEAGYYLTLLYAQSGQTTDALALLQEFLDKKPEMSFFIFSALQEQIQRGQTLEADVLCQALGSQTGFKAEISLLKLQIELLHDNQAGLKKCLKELALEDSAAFEKLYCHKELPDTVAFLPREYLDTLPRDPAWYRELNPNEVNAWLLNSAQWPVQKCHWKPQKSKKIILVMDAQALLWQEWYRLHLQALPKHWEIRIYLRHHFLQSMLSQEMAHSAAQIELLPTTLSVAVEHLLAAKAELILFSNPELDPLQFWLAQTRLAPLQLAWSATFPENDFRAESTSALDGALPLWPLSSVVQKPRDNPPGKLLAVGPMGLSQAEISSLKALENRPLGLLCSMLDLSKVSKLSDDLQIPVKVWRNLNELDALLSQAEALILPQKQAMGLYLGAAKRHAIPIFSDADAGIFSTQKLNSADRALSLTQDALVKTAWQDWANDLPATVWAVRVQDWFQHQSKQFISLGGHNES